MSGFFTQEDRAAREGYATCSPPDDALTRYVIDLLLDKVRYSYQQNATSPIEVKLPVYDLEFCLKKEQSRALLVNWQSLPRNEFRLYELWLPKLVTMGRAISGFESKLTMRVTPAVQGTSGPLSLIHISEPTRPY